MGLQNYERLHDPVRGRLQKQVCAHQPIVTEIRSICSIIALSPLYLRCPSEPAHWLALAQRSLFRNYKSYNSIVLMTSSDADWRITWFCLGDYGHLSYSSVYSVSSLCKKLARHEMALPPPQRLPNSDVELSFVFSADEIFPLSQNIIEPCNRSRLISVSERLYNFRHSRGRMPVECQSGNLLQKWEISQQLLGFDLSVTNDIITSLLALNNFLMNTEHPD
ncbi:hypothetical protein QAD02_003276 [Eretmocerus hayati]|uniref:Uncharacterized protein n=1 Tax=Eretmocerus hayati TaxID=131215 RepID=A0ACC2NLL8_9HYME|nr:hypothetical protein QAD02_003276 [Eretmocerus hayati]